jgi:hypothetical protein
MLAGQAVSESEAEAGYAHRYRRWSGLYILYIALMTVVDAVLLLREPNGWTPADWLINYEGGFVRRGLSGEALLELARATHVPLPWLGMAVPLLLYGLLYYSVWLLCQRTGWSLWVVAALVSPATLAFPVLSILGGFRKELLFLAGLAGLLLLLQRPRKQDALIATYLLVLSTVIVLCHEGMLAFLPYFAAALLIGLRDVKRTIMVVLPAVAGALVAFLEVMHHAGNVATSQAICSSLAEPAVVCSGAIRYLTLNKEFARGEVVFYVHQYHYLFYFPLVAFMGALPLALGVWTLYRHPELRRDLIVVLATVLLSMTGSTPLFLYAQDWGRWIYVHLFSVFLLLLFVDWRRQSNPQTRESLAPQGTLKQLRWKAITVFVYAISWNIPHYGNFPKKGYFNVPAHLLKAHLTHGAARSDDNP